jgi:hypothetical protein
MSSCVGQLAAAEERSIVPPTSDYASFFEEAASSNAASDAADEVAGEATGDSSCDAGYVVPCLPPPCADFYRLRFPCSYVWAEGLILKRDNQAANRPLVLDLNTDEVLLTVGDLDFD